MNRTPRVVNQTWLSNFNKTRYISTFPTGQDNISGEKRVPETGKRVRKTSHFHCQEFHKNTELHIDNMYVEDHTNTYSLTVT